MNDIRGIIYSWNPVFSAVRLLFLKYAIDNNVGVTSMEDMQQCARAQKMFAMRDVNAGTDILFDVLKYIDKAYGLDDILSRSIDQYARELFGMDSTASKKGVTTEGFKRLLDMLGQYDFEEIMGEHEIGRQLVDGFTDVFYKTSDRRSAAGEHTSKRSLALLAKKILNVTPADTFCDFTSGAGLSTLAIAGDIEPTFINVEINEEMAAISAMLYILQGFSHFNVIRADSLRAEIPNVSADRIFVDGPISVKIEDPETNRYRDSSLVVVDKTVHYYLKDGGIAVLTVPSGVLFNASKPARSLREELIEQGMIDAVIALPPLWNGTNIGTNLLIINKGEPRKDILFINALDATLVRPNGTAKSGGELPEAEIERIVSAIHSRTPIAGFSAVADSAEIRNHEFNLTPAAYVASIAEEDTTTLEEIDSELQVLYRNLLECMQ